MKAVVAAFNQEKALVGAFSVITNLRMELFESLLSTPARTMVTMAVRSEERDKWMIAGDISSWAEGGASMCHTVTPPAQTTISSGQDFITIYQKIQNLFYFFPTRRRRQ